MKLEISKKDWSLTKSDFCKKYGMSEIEYKNINKIRNEYLINKISLPDPLIATINDDSHVTFDNVNGTTSKEQNYKISQNSIKAKIDSSGNSVIEISSTDRLFIRICACLAIVSSCVKIYHCIKGIK